MTRNLREFLGVLAALLLGLAAAIAVTWPMVKYLDQVVLGGGELGGGLWRYDWHYKSLEALSGSDLGPIQRWMNFVALGRYPETGNVLDVLGLSYPLEILFGFPSSYNLKILIILAVNGVCGYALGRYFSGSIAGGLCAAAIAAINPLTLNEIQACGVRQSVLWWLLLFPPLFDQALRRRTLRHGFVAGAAMGLAGAWYWFYALFAGIFAGIWLLKTVVAERSWARSRGLVRASMGTFFGILVFAGPFLTAYLVREPVQEDPNGQADTESAPPLLPEMTFFLPFPSYDTVSHSPMRPQTYAENVLASINRTIGSSWSATFPVDPGLNESLPLTILVFGLLPAFARQRSWPWLAVWLFFYLGVLGPFLRVGDGDNRNVLRFGEYVVRMPYTLMFQFIPGMSRMFAPYRMASVLVVASCALVAVGVARLPFRSLFAPIVITLTVLQPMYRWGKGSVNEGDGSDARELRSPIKANRIRVPDYYKQIDPNLAEGIVELPLDQQQDLTYYYQLVHRQKVYRSWAGPGALPPFVRKKGQGGDAGERLRYQAKPDLMSGPIADVWMGLSTRPDTVDLTALNPDSLLRWAKAGNYTRIIVHERGYFLVDPTRGAKLFSEAVGRLSSTLGVSAVVLEELRKGNPAKPEFGVPIMGDLVPWTSQPAELPPERAPDAFHMAVIELSALPTAAEPPPLPPDGAVQMPDEADGSLIVAPLEPAAPVDNPPAP